MRTKLIRILIPLSLFALVAFAVVIANQTAQLIALVDRFHPLAGDIAFWSAMTLYAFCLVVPVFMILTLPAPLSPPDVAAGPEYEKHITRLSRRLSRNPHIAATVTTPAEIETALDRLHVISERRTKEAASQVFITTAISQNGSLDALLVLAAQSKLVLEIARIYYQRPTLRDLLYLYTNVGATAFIATELEDVDLSEQVQPVLTAVVGSTAGAIPGLGAAASLFVNSVTTGAGNAFLTLRVGLITEEYCRSLVAPKRRLLRRSAALRATVLLGSVAREGAASVAAAIWARPRQYFRDLIESAGSRVTTVSESLRERSSAAWQKVVRTANTEL